jgi:hypothetical protein
MYSSARADAIEPTAANQYNIAELAFNEAHLEVGFFSLLTAHLFRFHFLPNLA